MSPEAESENKSDMSESEGESISQREKIIRITKSLLERCDGARMRDGAGFNKFDSSFVRDVMSTPDEDLTDKQIEALRDSLVKYEKQIKGMGLDYSAVTQTYLNTSEEDEDSTDKDSDSEEEEEVSEENTSDDEDESEPVVSDITIHTVHDNKYNKRVYLDSPYEAKDDIKALDWDKVHYNWDGSKKAWGVDLDTLPYTLEKLQNGWTISVTDEVKEAYEEVTGFSLYPDKVEVSVEELKGGNLKIMESDGEREIDGTVEVEKGSMLKLKTPLDGESEEITLKVRVKSDEDESIDVYVDEKWASLKPSDVTDDIDELLYNRISYRVQNADHIDSVKRGDWDGYERLYDQKRHRVPNGLVYRVKDVLEEKGYEVNIIDERDVPEPSADFEWEFEHDLRGYQVDALNEALQRNGIINLPTGAGKTVVGLRLIQELGQKSIVLVHKTDLLYQWVEEIQDILGVPEEKIGIIGDGNWEEGDITVAMLQTLSERGVEELDDYDLLMVDECIGKNEPIKMADGSTKPINDVEIGDEVMSYNFETGELESKRVTNKWDKGVKETIKANGVRCTPDHEFYTESGKVEAKNIDDQNVLVEPKQYLSDKYGREMSRMWKRVVDKEYIIPSFKRYTWDRPRLSMFKMWEEVQKFRGIRRTCENCTCGWFGKTEREGKEDVGRTNKEREKRKGKGLHRFKQNGEKPNVEWRNSSSDKKENCCQSSKQRPRRFNLRYMWRKSRYNINRCRWSMGNINPSQRWRQSKQQPRKLNTFMQFMSSKGSQQGRLFPFEIHQTGNGGFAQGGSLISIRGDKKRKRREMRVYDIEVEDNHNFFVRGNLVSNCHHFPADSFYQVSTDIDTYYKYGLSATAYRNDNADMKLWAGLGDITAQVTAEELIDEGFLAEPEFEILEWDCNYVTQRNYDGQRQDMRESENRNEAIVERAKELREQGYKVLIDVYRIPHGKNLAEQLDTEFVYGNTPSETREEAVERFEEAENGKVIVSTLLDEGVDIPELNAIILSDIGKSSIKTIQTIGRALRPQNGDKAKIIDLDDRKAGGYVRDHFKQRQKAMKDYYGKYYNKDW